MENHNGVTTRCSGNRTSLEKTLASAWDRDFDVLRVRDEIVGLDPQPARAVAGAIGHNDPVTNDAGKRAGSRRGPRKTPSVDRTTLASAAGVTATVVAWGYLVYAAIEFGGSARDGESLAWGLLILASLGAVACLFVGLMLVAGLLRRLGVTAGPSESESRELSSAERRPHGGHRAAR